MIDVQEIAAWWIVGGALAAPVAWLTVKALGGAGAVAERFERWVERVTRVQR